MTENTKVTIMHGKFEFTLRGVLIRSQGFMEIANWVRSDDKVVEKIDKNITTQISEVIADERRGRLIQDGPQNQTTSEKAT